MREARGVRRSEGLRRWVRGSAEIWAPIAATRFCCRGE